MVQKVSEVVGVSPEGFAKAAQNAIETAAKSVRNLRWFRVTELEGMIRDQKVTEYKATVRLYFDYED
jgi:flavin-binding protein dodecin